MTMPHESQIRHQSSNEIDTFRGDDSSHGEAPMTAATLSTSGHNISPNGRAKNVVPRGYVAAMTTNAATIAAVIRDRLRERITYMPDRKLHALLYLAQQIAFEAGDQALFDDDMVATEVGVTMLDLGAVRSQPFTDSQFAVAVLTASRYGDLPTTDLEAMIRGQVPWQRAYHHTPGRRIDPDIMRAAIRSLDNEPAATVTGVSRTARAKMRHPGSEPLRNVGDTPDSPEDRAAFLAEARSRM